MTARKPRTPFDFSRVSREVAAQQVAGPVAESELDAPPALEAELDILQAPPTVEMTAEDTAPPTPVRAGEPVAEPPLPPVVLPRVDRVREPSGS
ncbi:MAG TPA: hypothetical protein PLO65_01515, partial [Caulobacter sp.]|nr:hypothetical protein [Caulobacter sp.]